MFFFDVSLHQTSSFKIFTPTSHQPALNQGGTSRSKILWSFFPERTKSNTAFTSLIEKNDIIFQELGRGEQGNTKWEVDRWREERGGHWTGQLQVRTPRLYPFNQSRSKKRICVTNRTRICHHLSKEGYASSRFNGWFSKNFGNIFRVIGWGRRNNA